MHPASGCDASVTGKVIENWNQPLYPESWRRGGEKRARSHGKLVSTFKSHRLDTRRIGRFLHLYLYSFEFSTRLWQFSYFPRAFRRKLVYHFIYTIRKIKIKRFSKYLYKILKSMRKIARRRRRRNLRVRRGKWLPLRGKIIPVYNTPVLQSKRMRDRWNCR